MADEITENFVHRFPIRVYFEDTDAGRVVYHASYLRFAERARTEMLRDLGFPHDRLMREHGLMFVVSRMEIDFTSPARLDDQLDVRTTIATLGGASVRLGQIIIDALDPAMIRARLTVRLATIDANGRPARLPVSFIDKTKLAASHNRI